MKGFALAVAGGLGTTIGPSLWFQGVAELQKQGSGSNQSEAGDASRLVVDHEISSLSQLERGRERESVRVFETVSHSLGWS